MESDSSEQDRQSEDEVEPKGEAETNAVSLASSRAGNSPSVPSLPAGDSDYLPPEEAAAHQTKQHGLLQNLTSPLKKEASGEYDQKLVHTLISAHHNIRSTSFFPKPLLPGARPREAV